MDHVYISKEFLSETDVTESIIDIYSSDLMLLNLLLLTGINNACSTSMEEMFVEEILAEDIFIYPKIAKLFKFFLMGTNHKSKFCKFFLKWFSHKTKMYLLVIYPYILKILYVQEWKQ